MITIESLTKRYAGFTAVDDVSFTARPGRVTGFLGPNGAGKSTTMRIMVGLTPATSGSATIEGRRFADLPNPGREVGVLLDASAQHAGRTGREILRIAQDPLSLDSPVGEADDSNLSDFIEDLQAEAPADAAARTMLVDAVVEAMSELNEREQQVVRLRFGLEDGQSRTLEEVGKEFGVTRERIRQIESKTLAKLRHPHRSQKLRDYLEAD